MTFWKSRDTNTAVRDGKLLTGFALSGTWPLSPPKLRRQDQGQTIDAGPKKVHFQTMKVLTVSAAKTRLGRVIDQVIKTHEPVVIPRGQKHVVIMPYSLPSPEELELAAVFREVDKGRAPVEEDASTVEAIREEIQKYRAEK